MAKWKRISKYTKWTKKLDVKYKYSDDGIRTEKIVNGIVTNYYLEDDLVIYEIQGFEKWTKWYYWNTR
mgnify:CR=1 FL=1